MRQLYGDDLVRCAHCEKNLKFTLGFARARERVNDAKPRVSTDDGILGAKENATDLFVFERDVELLEWNLDNADDLIARSTHFLVPQFDDDEILMHFFQRRFGQEQRNFLNKNEQQ